MHIEKELKDRSWNCIKKKKECERFKSFDWIGRIRIWKWITERWMSLKQEEIGVGESEKFWLWAVLLNRN